MANEATATARAEETHENAPEVLQSDIEKLAYALWEQRGCPVGSPEQDWYIAEEQLRTKTTGV